MQTAPALAHPPYSSYMAAYHKAFASELERLTRELPICAGDHVLDMGCGDGFYTGWLTSLAAPNGTVTGLDQSESNLTSAREQYAHHPLASHMRFLSGDIAKLPFRSNTFDLVWCAQNLFSFPDPESALKELVRVTRPGGIVAVLENDSLHQVLLPLPVPVELALAQAELAYFQQKSSQPDKYYVARGLRKLLKQAGLRPQRKKLYASQREVPFTTDEQKFLRLYLQGLSERVSAFLKPSMREAVLDVLTPGSAGYLPDQDELTLTCLDHVAWGKKPTLAYAR